MSLVGQLLCKSNLSYIARETMENSSHPQYFNEQFPKHQAGILQQLRTLNYNDPLNLTKWALPLESLNSENIVGN